MWNWHVSWARDTGFTIWNCAKSCISLHPATKFRDPCDQDCYHTTASRRVNAVPQAVVRPVLLHQWAKDTVQGGPQFHSCGCTLDVGVGWAWVGVGGWVGDGGGGLGAVGGTETPSWCCAGSLFAPNWIMVGLCKAKRLIPIWDKWTSKTMDKDPHLERSAPAQSPVCKQRPMNPHLRNIDLSCTCIIIWIFVLAWTMLDITLCLEPWI